MFFSHLLLRLPFSSNRLSLLAEEGKFKHGIHLWLTHAIHVKRDTYMAKVLHAEVVGDYDDPPSAHENGIVKQMTRIS